MNKQEYKKWDEKYSPFITKMIGDNYRFYRIRETIRWCFCYDEDDSIIATCNRENNIISINLKSVIRANAENDMKTIEYFLLHEIRHIFQHIRIRDYKKGLDTDVSVDLIEKWIYENEHYIKAKDQNGKENPQYFAQDSELDAYAFSYAVMKYKYGDVSVYVPPVYGKEFDDIVNKWIEEFKKEE